MPRFTIIVPVEGDLHAFENTLASVLRRCPSDAEVRVVHHGQYLDPHGLEPEVRFSVADRDANLIRMFNRGLRESDSELVAIFRPGIELTDGWARVVELAMDEDPRVASVSPALIARDRRNRLLAAGVQPGWGMTRQLVGAESRTNSRSARRLKPWGPTLWAAFYRRAALEQLGTPDEDLDPMYLDLDLAMGLRQLGLRSRFAPACLCGTSNPELFQWESRQPHGLSAERARRRHPDVAKSNPAAAIFGWELLGGLLQPRRLKQLGQRMGASSYADIDSSYCRRLAEKRESVNERVLPVRETAPPAFRRAA